MKLTEASKGGLKFEVVLSQAAVPTPPRSLSPTLGVRPIISVEKIQQKLEQAAERRQVLNFFISLNFFDWFI